MLLKNVYIMVVMLIIMMFNFKLNLIVFLRMIVVKYRWSLLVKVLVMMNSVEERWLFSFLK